MTRSNRIPRAGRSVETKIVRSCERRRKTEEDEKKIRRIERKLRNLVFKFRG